MLPLLATLDLLPRKLMDSPHISAMTPMHAKSGIIRPRAHQSVLWPSMESAE